jgi:hypothetical protein
MKLRELIEQIEEHTGEKFDLNKRRHFFHLSQKIDRLYQRERRQLNAIRSVLSADRYDPRVYDHNTHQTTKRRDVKLPEEVVTETVTSSVKNYVRNHTQKESLLYNNRLFLGYVNPSEKREAEYIANINYILDFFKTL